MLPCIRALHYWIFYVHPISLVHKLLYRDTMSLYILSLYNWTKLLDESWADKASIIQITIVLVEKANEFGTEIKKKQSLFGATNSTETGNNGVCPLQVKRTKFSFIFYTEYCEITRAEYLSLCMTTGSLTTRRRHREFVIVSHRGDLFLPYEFFPLLIPLLYYVRLFLQFMLRLRSYIERKYKRTKKKQWESMWLTK